MEDSKIYTPKTFKSNKMYLTAGHTFRENSNLKRYIHHRDVPGDPVVKTSPPKAGVWVRSLVRELKSQVPHGQNTKKHKTEIML